MSTLIWFILIIAFMFFMHRGHGSHGGGMRCGGGHETRFHSPYDEKGREYKSQAEIAAIPEAEYVEVEDEPAR
jgi:hypothetical protein